MAKELMTARHELEASRRANESHRERTLAAEKSAAKATAAMHEAHAAHARLREQHERVLTEVQMQRNRVAKLRLAVKRVEGSCRKWFRSSRRSEWPR